MKKNFVLDTNVLLHDPLAIDSFADNDVIIPIYVIEEIDSFKKDLSELGRNARHVSRKLDKLREHGSLVEGVPINGHDKGILKVSFAKNELPPRYALSRHSTDNRIIASALELKNNEPKKKLIFISKDINLRIRAAALGLKVQDYDVEKSDIDELWSGVSNISTSRELIGKLYKDSTLKIKELDSTKPPLYPNEFAILTDAGGQSSALARLNPSGRDMYLLGNNMSPIWGITPRNKEQRFAFDILLDDNINLVTLVGQAGTGKTLLALAAGMQKVAEENKYQRMLVSRPVFPLGKDIGFLPGDVEDKLRPWMQPVYDNLELLLGITKSQKKTGRDAQELFDMDMIHVEPLTYIRGRSIPNQFIVVDEAQNLTPHEVKTIITRAGESTKIVLTGDPYQIDNPYVDSTNNGLIHVVKRFKEESISGHITLAKGERSELAERAAFLL